MTGRVESNQTINPQTTRGNNAVQNKITLEDISVFWETSKKEEKRSNFDETFTANSNSKTGQKFLSGLIENKDDLCLGLGISEEQYDVFSCVALALATQETGMGKETGYLFENMPIIRDIRTFLKDKEVENGGLSASSGITQAKINDFMKSLPQEDAELLRKLGIITEDLNINNLYQEPDKAAIATIVVLNSIAKNYDEYQEVLNQEHNKYETDLTEEQKTRSEELMSSIIDIYNSEDISDEDKKELRESFAHWILSEDNSRKGDDVSDKFNEELNLERLNTVLKKNGFMDEINLDDIKLVRYYLTSEEQSMDLIEYYAHGWNNGTAQDGYGMKPDVLLSTKIRTMFPVPEDFGYGQYTPNVARLTEEYIAQSTDEVDDAYIEELFEEFDYE